MEKIRILAIAPYQGMADLIREEGQKRGDIELTVETGDMYEGKRIAEELAQKNFDIIISRGGTAQMIRTAVEIPVIDISISGYDILRAIRLAQSYSGKSVIAGFPAITQSAKTLCDLLQYDVRMITFGGDTEPIKALRQAGKQGCTLALCDVTGLNAAKKIGMNAILISSGSESVQTAIGDAVKMVRSSFYIHKQKELFQSLLKEGGQEFLIYDPAGTLWFSSIDTALLSEPLMGLVHSNRSAFLKKAGHTVSRQLGDKVWTMTGRHLFYDGQKYTAVIIRQAEAFSAEAEGSVRIYNKDDLADAAGYFGYYGSSNKLGGVSELIDEYSRSKLPVLVLGEAGTGKDRVASLLYENGVFEHAPFYVIDCTRLTEHKWNALFESDNSPLNTVHTTIYFRHLTALTVRLAERMIGHIQRTDLVRRNRLLFSILQDGKDPEREASVRTLLETKLSCLTLRLLPLRERKDDLPSITTLYLHQLNMSSGKQIIGFEAEAMERMTAFPWPRNLDQLHHVLLELMTMTHTPYISLDHTELALKQEQEKLPAPRRIARETSVSGANAAKTGADFQMQASESALSGTLDEITYRIICAVLNEEGGSKEKTAKRLDISRSTLWRILKNHDGQ